MQTIDLADIQAGDTFDAALRDGDGRVLLAPGEPMTGAMLTMLLAAGVAEVAIDGFSTDESELEYVETNDTAFNVPEASGDDFPPPANHHLRERRTTLARLRREAEETVMHRSARWSRLSLRIAASVRWSGTETEQPFSTDSERDWTTDEQTASVTRRQRINLLRRTFSRLISGETVGAGTLNEIVAELIDDACRRGPMYGAIALGGADRADDLVEHCFATGALSVGIAMHLGWSPADVRAAGLAGLLADAGLALLPSPLRTLDRPLTDIETNTMRRHAAYSAALVERIVAITAAEAIPEGVQLALHQHHERQNGSGYPTGARSEQIHDLAKVVAVADVFAGLTAPRAHRPALPAPTAIAEIARQANAGVLDQHAAAALIEICGVYPPGSRVRLSTGHEAIVVCNSGGDRLDRPVVRVVGSDGGADETGEGESIDLSRWRDEDVSVVALAA